MAEVAIIAIVSKMASVTEESAKIKVTVKTPKEKQEIEIDSDATIKDVSFVLNLVIKSYAI